LRALVGLCLPGLLLAVLAVGIASALWQPEGTVHTHLDVCPVFELVATAEPRSPVVDPDMGNNFHSQQVFVCPR